MYPNANIALRDAAVESWRSGRCIAWWRDRPGYSGKSSPNWTLPEARFNRYPGAGSSAFGIGGAGVFGAVSASCKTRKDSPKVASSRS
jgi:hypothetical protein